MRGYIKQACEEIDAAMFSGDAFIAKDERDALVYYIERWQRQLKVWEEIDAKGAQQPKVVICDNSPCEYCTRKGYECDRCKGFSYFNGRKLTII
jgi:hypothetical protein